MNQTSPPVRPLRQLSVAQMSTAGKCHPPYQPEWADRPAYYEAGGFLFDMHGREIREGLPLSAAPTPVARAKPDQQRQYAQGPVARHTDTVVTSTPAKKPDPALTMVTGLLLMEPDMGPEFSTAAKKLLEKHSVEVPALRGVQQRKALIDALTALESRLGTAPLPFAPPVSFSDDPLDAAPVEDLFDGSADDDDGPSEDADDGFLDVGDEVVEPMSVAGPTRVDLKAWGEGRRNYLWHEVVEAMRAQHHVRLGPDGKRHAVDVLVESGVIEASNARRDV